MGAWKTQQINQQVQKIVKRITNGTSTGYDAKAEERQWCLSATVTRSLPGPCYVGDWRGLQRWSVSDNASIVKLSRNNF